MGKNFDSEYKPDLSPKEMLTLGVFGGAYFIGENNLKPKEYPASWWRKVKLSPDSKQHKENNFFGVLASQSLTEWQRKGWIGKDDPHGWFEWYCRYYMGRRLPKEDAKQIQRWRAIRRHIGQIRAHCRPGDIHCRPRQRQALLHWAYDSRKY